MPRSRELLPTRFPSDRQRTDEWRGVVARTTAPCLVGSVVTPVGARLSLTVRHCGVNGLQLFCRQQQVTVVEATEERATLSNGLAVPVSAIRTLEARAAVALLPEVAAS